MPNMDDALNTLAGLSVDSKNDTSNESLDLINNGLTDISKNLEQLFAELSASLTEEMKKILDAINGVSKEGKETKENAQKAMGISNDSDSEGTPLDELLGDSSGSGGGTFIPPKSGFIKPDDLQNIDQNYALSGLLIYYKLDEIQKALMPLLKKGGGNADTKRSAGGNGDSELSDIDGIIGAAKALKEFAKAALILAFVPKKAAMAGLEMFIFMLESINDLSAEIDIKEFDQLTKTVERLVDTLKSYAIACILLTLLLPFEVMAVPAIILMGFSMKLLSKISEGVKESISNFAMMAVGFAILAVGFILMGVAFLMMAKIKDCLPDALLGIAASMLVIVATALLGMVMSNFIPVFIIMPIVCILVSLGYIFLFAAIGLLSKFKPDWDNIKNTLKNLLVFFGLTALLAVSCIPLLVPIAFLVVAGVLLFAGFTAIMLSLVLLAFVGFFLGDGAWVKDVMTILKDNLFGVFLDPLFIGAIYIAAISAIGLAVAGLGLLIGFLTLMLALLCLKGINAILEGMDLSATFGNIKFIMEETASIGVVALLAAVASIPLAVFGAVFAVAMITMALGMTLLWGLSKIVDKIDNPESLGLKLRNLTIKVLLGVMGIKSDGKDSIGLGDLVKGGLNIVSMIAAAVLMIPLSVALSAAFLGFSIMTTALIQLNKNLNVLGPKEIENVMGMLGTILTTLADSAKAFQDTSAETIVAIGSLVKDVATALDTITNVVIKLKDGIPDEQIDAATTAIRHICERLFGGPNTPKDVYTLTTLFKELASADLKDLNASAMQAINPIIDSIGKLTNLILSITQEDSFSQENIEIGALAIERVVKLMSRVGECMKGLTDEGIFGFSESPLEAMKKVQEANFFELFNSILVGLKSSSDAVAEVNIDNFYPVVNFLSGDFTAFYDGCVLFGKSVSVLDSKFSRMGKDTLQNMKTFMDILDRDATGITQTISSLTNFANNATKFESIANSFERLAKSMKTMNNNVGGVKGFFDKIINNSDKVQASANAAAAQTGGSEVDPAVDKLYEILSNWDKDGVPIKANMDTKTGDIKPVDKDNNTGKGSKR